MGEGQEENAIVTSTGQYVIAWDFAKVKKGYLDKYEIKKYEDHVVQDNFKFGDDKEIVCILFYLFPIGEFELILHPTDRCPGEQCPRRQQEEFEAADEGIDRDAKEESA